MKSVCSLAVIVLSISFGAAYAKPPLMLGDFVGQDRPVSQAPAPAAPPAATPASRTSAPPVVASAPAPQVSAPAPAVILVRTGTAHRVLPPDDEGRVWEVNYKAHCTTYPGVREQCTYREAGRVIVGYAWRRRPVLDTRVVLIDDSTMPVDPYWRHERQREFHNYRSPPPRGLTVGPGWGPPGSRYRHH
ncbi:MAG TPA: hypothetical protein VHC20_00345 [Candidatus Paceibacterota bacterium]|nr:hypothetical protein [Candidatus Paceibacterota bacterium]